MNRIAICALLVVAACKAKDKPPASGSASTGSGSPTKPGAPAASTDPAVLSASAAASRAGQQCTHSVDCPRTFDPCHFQCTQTAPEAPKSYCQLWRISTAEGDGPCIGDTADGGGSSTFEATVGIVPVVVLCDVTQRLYCGPAGRCVPSLPLGAKCGYRGDACGPDGYCPEDELCAAAPGPGQPCVHDRCNAAAYCDERDQCVARQAIGTDCDGDHERCQSGNCGRIRAGTYQCVKAASRTCEGPPPRYY